VRPGAFIQDIDFIGPKELACAREVLLLLVKHAHRFACLHEAGDSLEGEAGMKCCNAKRI
jgi:hypothetical protein